jgi:hypothetical protein
MKKSIPVEEKLSQKLANKACIQYLRKNRNELEQLHSFICDILYNNQNWKEIITSTQMSIEIVILFEK